MEMMDMEPEKMADLICVLIARYKGLKAQDEALEGLFGG